MDWQSFGANLRRARRSRRLSQAELARRAGLTWQYISNLERDLARPRRGDARLLAKALGVSVATLFRPDPTPVRADALIALRDGSAAPGRVAIWCFDAATRGIDLEIKRSGLLVVGPAALVTRADEHFISANGPALAAYIRHLSEQAGRPS
jgi:transcriptional regulator with XRE-family HTH domain